MLDHLCREVEARVPDSVCSIMYHDPERGALFVEAGPGISDELKADLDGLVPAALAGSCGSAVYTGEPAIVADTSTDPRWAAMQDFAEKWGIRSCWSVPVRAERTTLGGSFAISRTVTGAPSSAVLTLLEAGGYLVGLGLQRMMEEREQAVQHEMLQAVVEDTADSIWVKDRDGRYVFVNAAEARGAGLTKKEMIGKKDADVYPAEPAQRNRETDLEVILTGHPVSYVTDFDEPDGQRTYHVRKHPRFNRTHEVTEVIGIARDVTDQERAQRALQQTQKLESLGLLAGGIAHDFNNILVGILGNAEWLLEHCDVDESVREPLSEIRHSARRAAGLTRQMLAYAGKGRFSRESIDVASFVRDVLELIRGTLSHTDVRVSVDEAVPNVSGDPNQIRQVLMNLLVNAGEAHATKASGHIMVRVSRLHATGSDAIETVEGSLEKGHYVTVTVEDNGEGMSDETLARIFDPFFSTKVAGRGLGLAAVLGILKAHGGAIHVTSAPQQGTTFRVFLPVENPAESTSVGAKPVVLVADDEAVVRNVVQRLLEGAGFEVVTAADGADALQILASEARHIDVAIVDHNMPGLSGLEVWRRARILPDAVPIVLATGGGDGTLLADVEVPVVHKPFTLDEVLATLNRAREGAPRSARPKTQTENEATQ
ncbi:MAG: hypothetical protein CMJ83_10885 [Planctomycetes bacterium]|nr:hypothetical protein [Planctomycetota bacterium]